MCRATSEHVKTIRRVNANATVRRVPGGIAVEKGEAMLLIRFHDDGADIYADDDEDPVTLLSPEPDYIASFVCGALRSLERLDEISNT